MREVDSKKTELIAYCQLVPRGARCARDVLTMLKDKGPT